MGARSRTENSGGEPGMAAALTGRSAPRSDRAMERAEETGEHQVGRRAEGRIPARNRRGDSPVVVRRVPAGVEHQRHREEPGPPGDAEHREDEHPESDENLDDRRAPLRSEEPEADVDRPDPRDERSFEEQPPAGRKGARRGPADDAERHAHQHLAPAGREASHATPSARATWKVTTAPTYARVVIERKA